ncbi:MAG: protein kinase [Deltaproteobacteria bacterium]|nr:protein kinase [Deltaproteobacteria bacterium]
MKFGKYLLLERINVGGMAEVFKAKTFGVAGFERIVAIKRILPNMVEDDEFIKMFIDEARIAVQLAHANVAQIYELGQYGNNYYIAMEYISSRDLRTILDRLRQSGTLMPIPQAAYIASRICEGLDYAHRKKDAAGRPLNIIHRDVSPQNVLLSYDGEIKLIDFGIAKAANRASKTQAGVLKGKFGYMSPEQVRGLVIDRRSDIFAVGVLLYEMLTGERLFIGESDFSTLERVRNAEVLPPTTYNKKISPELETIVLKSLAREAEDRYQWASDLAEDLQRFMIEDRSIFSAKKLSEFMHETYAPELALEQAKMEEYLKVEGPAEEDLPLAPGAAGGLIKNSAYIIESSAPVGAETSSDDLFPPGKPLRHAQPAATYEDEPDTEMQDEAQVETAAIQIDLEDEPVPQQSGSYDDSKTQVTALPVGDEADRNFAEEPDPPTISAMDDEADAETRADPSFPLERSAPELASMPTAALERPDLGLDEATDESSLVAPQPSPNMQDEMTPVPEPSIQPRRNPPPMAAQATQPLAKAPERTGTAVKTAPAAAAAKARVRPRAAGTGRAATTSIVDRAARRTAEISRSMLLLLSQPRSLVIIGIAVSMTAIVVVGALIAQRLITRASQVETALVVVAPVGLEVPPRIEVIVDGQARAQQLPARVIGLKPGSHQLLVRAPGFVDFRLPHVIVEQDETLTIEASLFPMEALQGPASAASAPTMQPDVATSQPSASPASLPGPAVAMATAIDAAATRPDARRPAPGAPDAAAATPRHPAAGIAGVADAGTVTKPKPAPKPEPARPASLIVTSDPQGADVSVDGDAQGTTPATITSLLSDRSYAVVIALDGYREHRTKVSFGGQTEKTLDVKLKKKATAAAKSSRAEVELAINTTPPATIYVNGKKTNKRTPLWPGQGIKLAVGTHLISFETSDSARFNYEVTLKEGDTSKRLIIKRLGGPPGGDVEAVFKQ